MPLLRSPDFAAGAGFRSPSARMFAPFGSDDCAVANVGASSASANAAKYVLMRDTAGSSRQAVASFA